MDTNNTRNWLIIGAVVIVLLGLGWWLMARGRSASPNTDATTGATSTVGTTLSVGAPVTTTASGESVSAKDQTAGLSVAVEGMNLAKVSWVAVRDVKGQRILGAHRFEAGVTAGEVSLLKPTVAGGEYQVLVYVDDGDKKFDMKKDALVEDVSATFKAQ